MYHVGITYEVQSLNVMHAYEILAIKYVGNFSENITVELSAWYLTYQQSLFLVCQLNFVEIIRLSKIEVSLASPSFGDITRFKTAVCLN